MWYLTTLHNEPLFYINGDSAPIEVNDLPYVTGHKTDTGYIRFYPPLIGDSEKAVSILTKNGVPGFNRKIDAKAYAKEQNLRSFKYLNTKANFPTI